MIQTSPYLAHQLRSEISHISNYLQSYGGSNSPLLTALERVSNAVVAHTLTTMHRIGSADKTKKYEEEQDVQVFQKYLQFLDEEEDRFGKNIRVWFDFSKYQPNYRQKLPTIPEDRQMQYTSFENDASGPKKDTSALIIENMDNVLKNLEGIHAFMLFIRRECIHRDQLQEELNTISNAIYEKKLFIKKEKIAMLLLRGEPEELNQLRHELFEDIGKYSTSHLFSPTFTSGSSYGNEHELKSELQRRLLQPIGADNTVSNTTDLNHASDLLGL